MSDHGPAQVKSLCGITIWLAWFSFFAHGVAALCMLVFMRQGLPGGGSTHSQIDYIAGHTLTWTLGWIVWVVAALSFLFFVGGFVRFHRSQCQRSALSVWLTIALTLAAVAVAMDCTANMAATTLLPRVGRAVIASSTDLATWFNIQRGLIVLSGAYANGFYSLSGLLLVLTTLTLYPRWVSVAGGIMAIAGFVLTVAAALDLPSVMIGSHTILLISLLIWMAGVAVSLQGIDKDPS